jgi:hypothetical protein
MQQNVVPVLLFVIDCAADNRSAGQNCASEGRWVPAWELPPVFHFSFAGCGGNQ